MPRFASAVVVVVALCLLTEVSLAERATRIERQRVGDTVYVEGRKVWTGTRGDRVVSSVRWSRHRDAVAFAVRRQTGGDQLVVVLVGGEVDRHTMRWPIPANAATAERARRRPTVTWMGRQRVAYGPTELRPTIVASWTVR